MSKARFGKVTETALRMTLSTCLGVAEIGSDQASDYAARKGIPLEEA